MDESLYAIGQQDFESLREGGAIYVDKTAFVEKIAKSNIRYFFSPDLGGLAKVSFCLLFSIFMKERGNFLKVSILIHQIGTGIHIQCCVLTLT